MGKLEGKHRDKVASLQPSNLLKVNKSIICIFPGIFPNISEEFVLD